jgi:hypothetical protein
MFCVIIGRGQVEALRVRRIILIDLHVCHSSLGEAKRRVPAGVGNFSRQVAKNTTRNVILPRIMVSSLLICHT